MNLRRKVGVFSFCFAAASAAMLASSVAAACMLLGVSTPPAAACLSEALVGATPLELRRMAVSSILRSFMAKT